MAAKAMTSAWRYLVTGMVLVLHGCEEAEGPRDAALPDAVDVVDVASDITPALDRQETGVDAVQPGVDGGFVDAMRCVPFRSYACACTDGRTGEHECTQYGDFNWSNGGSPPETDCDCAGVIDAGVSPSTLARRALPPRLVSPQSASRVTSQRPTMRWALPEGVTRARIEVCDDRACSTVIASAVVTGARWRPESALRPGVAFWRVQGLDADGNAVWRSPTWEYVVGHRDAPVDTSYGYLQDFDGDGLDDVLMTYTVENDDRLAIYPGGEDLISPDRVRYVLNVTHVQLYLGGDVNGDGLADVVDQTFPSIGFFGLLHGSRGTPTAADVTWPVRAPSWHVAYDVAGRCDVDGDGYSDVIVPINDIRRAYSLPSVWLLVYRGGPGALRDSPDRIASLTDYSFLNISAGCAGDVNGDGYQDVLLGFNGGPDWPAGHAALYLGGPSGLSNDALIPLVRPPRTQWFGMFRVRGAGDVNGDGFSDFFVDSWNNASLYYGRADFAGAMPDVTLSGSEPIGGTAYEGWFGRNPAGPADYNGDGYSDLAFDSVCAPGDDASFDCGPGRVYVFMGSASGVAAMPTATLAARPSLGTEHFGADMTAGDYNGDGFSDLLVDGRWALFNGVVLIYPGSARGISTNPSAVLRSAPGFGVGLTDRRRRVPTYGGA